MITLPLLLVSLISVPYEASGWLFAKPAAQAAPRPAGTPPAFLGTTTLGRLLVGSVAVTGSPRRPDEVTANTGAPRTGAPNTGASNPGIPNTSPPARPQSSSPRLEDQTSTPEFLTSGQPTGAPRTTPPESGSESKEHQHGKGCCECCCKDKDSKESHSPEGSHEHHGHHGHGPHGHGPHGHGSHGRGSSESSGSGEHGHHGHGHHGHKPHGRPGHSFESKEHKPHKRPYGHGDDSDGKSGGSDESGPQFRPETSEERRKSKENRPHHAGGESKFPRPPGHGPHGPVSKEHGPHGPKDKENESQSKEDGPLFRPENSKERPHHKPRPARPPGASDEDGPKWRPGKSKEGPPRGPAGKYSEGNSDEDGPQFRPETSEERRGRGRGHGQRPQPLGSKGDGPKEPATQGNEGHDVVIADWPADTIPSASDAAVGANEQRSTGPPQAAAEKL